MGSLGAVAGSQLVGGNPDFTDAPAHGGDDARFYDRQQAYVHARAGGGVVPRAPEPEFALAASNTLAASKGVPHTHMGL